MLVTNKSYYKYTLQYFRKLRREWVMQITRVIQILFQREIIIGEKKKYGLACRHEMPNCWDFSWNSVQVYSQFLLWFLCGNISYHSVTWAFIFTYRELYWHAYFIYTCNKWYSAVFLWKSSIFLLHATQLFHYHISDWVLWLADHSKRRCAATTEDTLTAHHFTQTYQLFPDHLGW